MSILDNVKKALGNLTPEQRAMMLRMAAASTNSPGLQRGMSEQAASILQAHQQQQDRDWQTQEKAKDRSVERMRNKAYADYQREMLKISKQRADAYEGAQGTLGEWRAARTARVAELRQQAELLRKSGKNDLADQLDRQADMMMGGRQEDPIDAYMRMVMPQMLGQPGQTPQTDTTLGNYDDLMPPVRVR